MHYLQLEIYGSHIISYFERFLSFGINNKSAFSGCTNCFMAFEATAEDTTDRLSTISQTKTIKINRKKNNIIFLTFPWTLNALLLQTQKSSFIIECQGSHIHKIPRDFACHSITQLTILGKKTKNKRKKNPAFQWDGML